MDARASEFAIEARRRYGIDVKVHEFPEGTETAEEAAAAVGCRVEQIASSLVFVVDDEPVVVVTSGANRVDERRLAEHFGADSARLADPDEVVGAVGWAVGGVPPVCHESAVPVLIDETLLGHDRVWAAAGTPAAVFPIDPATLRELADATPIAVSG